MRMTNIAGLALIKSFEGLSLKAYLCPAGVLTIGYGHTGDDVKPKMVITQEQADDLLEADLKRFEKAVEQAVTVDITDNQFSAMVALAFNIGIGAFQKSTLLLRLNNGKAEDSAKQFERWNKVGGRVLAGLTRRRAAEQKLFLAK